MTPAHTRKGQRRYRYYISRSLIDGRPAAANAITRVSAPEVERLVVEALRRRLACEASDAQMIAGTVGRVDLGADAIRVTLRANNTGDEADTEQPASLIIPWQRAGTRRHRAVIRVPDRAAPVRPMRVETRATLLTAIARGRRWLDEIVSGAATGPDAIAMQEGCSRRQVSALLSLAGLAPDIVEAAIAGRLPHGIALRDLTDLPLAWSEQRRRLGLQP